LKITPAMITKLRCGFRNSQSEHQPKIAERHTKSTQLKPFCGERF
jgi:hypothetical protein